MDAFLQRDSQCLKRDVLVLFPPTLEGVEEAPHLPPWPIIRTNSRPITLRFLAMYLPFEIVNIVEANVGWPEVLNDHHEDDQIVQNPMHPSEFQTLVRAMRNINQHTWIPNVSSILRNLHSYTTLLQTLLSELEFFRSMRSSAVSLQLALDINDFNGLESDLEVLANELGGVNYLTIHLDDDRHIQRLHQLVRFLNYPISTVSEPSSDL